MTRQTIEHLRQRTSQVYLRLRGLARRVVLSLTNNDGIWQALGYRGVDELGEDAEGEKFVAEVFPGLGFYARPKRGAKPEAVIIHIGAESNHPVIIATRDKAAQVVLNEDETAVFNSQSVVLIKADGTVEVRDRSGVAVPLALKADVDALRTWLATHTHSGVTTGTGSSAVPVQAGTLPNAAGTSKLRGQ